MTDASGYLRDWWNNNWNNQNFAADFANPWGVGQEVRCKLESTCDPISCENVPRKAEPESGPAYQIILSLQNLNTYLHNLYVGLQLSYSQWNGMQVDLQQKFWPSVKPDDVFLKDFLAGIAACVGMVAGIAGGPALGVAAPLVGGIAAVISNNISATDQSLENIAALEQTATTFYENTFKVIQETNSDLMSIGHHVFLDDSIPGQVLAVLGAVGMTPKIPPKVIDIQPLLADGYWSDYRGIPILNTDKSRPNMEIGDLKDQWYNIIFGQLVNYAWKQQGVYIIKYDMTQEEFDNFVSPYGSDDFRLKLYYGGSAFFFQGIDRNPAAGAGALPPGWGDLKASLKDKATTQDVLQSSADAWHDVGYGSTFSVDGASTDPTFLMQNALKMRGFWNIPVCVPRQKDVKDLTALRGFLTKDGREWVVPLIHNNMIIRPSWCYCRSTTDSSGKKFIDQFPDAIKSYMSDKCANEGMD